ncbi:MAG: hypothetical protein HY744_09695 [Deltaproteobacteria bacterium]|nr:hypothetical protein [Deltaproteobacteria bacterium]
MHTGRLMCWGDNEQGQVGKGDVGGLVAVPTAVASLDTYVEVSAGRRHCCAVRWDGTAWCWGANEHGQLGDGSKITALVPRPVKYLYGQQVAPLGHVANLALGATHTCAGDGLGLRCWGANLYGQLGDGTKVDKVLPAIVGGGMQISLGTDDLGLGAFHSLASLPHSDTLTSWGHNNAGQLGVDSTMDSSVPVTVTNYPCTTAQQAQKEPPPKFKGSFFTYGPELEPYEHPFAVAVDDVPQGRVFVSDTHAVRICRLEADGTGPLCWGSQCNLYDGYVGFPPGYGCVDPEPDAVPELVHDRRERSRAADLAGRRQHHLLRAHALRAGRDQDLHAHNRRDPMPLPARQPRQLPHAGGRAGRGRRAPAPAWRPALPSLSRGHPGPTDRQEGEEGRVAHAPAAPALIGDRFV